MKEYYIDFEGYTEISANSVREAQEKFYEEFAKYNPEYSVSVIGVEEAKEEEGM